MSRFVPTTLFAALLLAAVPAAAQQGPTGLSMPQVMNTGGANVGGNGLGGPQVLARRQAEVSGEFVNLGDLFSGLEAKAEIVVAYAPPAGETLVFDHNRLDALAREHGITWQVLGSGPAEVVISRAADTVSPERIRTALRDALAGQGLSPTSEVDLMTAVRSVAVPTGTLNPIAVHEATLDRHTGRFSAMIEIPAGAANATRQRVAGQVYETIEIPVAVRPINRDGVITESDIDWIKMRADRLQPGVATNMAEIVGMATRRSVRAGDPLRLRDLARPTLVARNELVTMILRNDFMTLTSRGRALQDGAIGDTVQVRNERSNKTVLGRVIDARTVVVDGTQNAAALLQ